MSEQNTSTFVQGFNNIGKKIRSVFGTEEWTQSVDKLLEVAAKLEGLSDESRVSEIKRAERELKDAMNSFTAQLDKIKTLNQPVNTEVN
jgi:hypothetical protein